MLQEWQEEQVTRSFRANRKSPGASSVNNADATTNGAELYVARDADRDDDDDDDEAGRFDDGLDDDGDGTNKKPTAPVFDDDLLNGDDGELDDDDNEELDNDDDNDGEGAKGKSGAGSESRQVDTDR